MNNREWTPSQWRDCFDDLLYYELDDKWTLNFNYSQEKKYELSPEEQRNGWMVDVSWPYGRFSCGRCSRRWNSMNVVVLFRYRLLKRSGRGTVILRPYGQACRRCTTFVLPGFLDTEVDSTLLGLFREIREKCYHEDDMDYLIYYHKKEVEYYSSDDYFDDDDYEEDHMVDYKVVKEVLVQEVEEVKEDIDDNEEVGEVGAEDEDIDDNGEVGAEDEDIEDEEVEDSDDDEDGESLAAYMEGILAGPVVKTFDWVVTSRGYAQAQHKAGYVLTSLSVTEEEKRQIERDTVGQSKNPLWSEYRKNRITSSNFGSVLAAVQHQSYPPSLFQTLRDQYRLKTQSKLVKWIIHHEPRAKQQYMEVTGMPLQERGVFLSDSGLLGASPGAMASGGDRIVEVKCPWSAREMTIRQAAAEIREFCLEFDEDETPALKPDHNYWHQIQGALHLSGANSCDLVIWTPRDLVILPVAKDPTWAGINIGILETFYKDVFLTHLLSQR